MCVAQLVGAEVVVSLDADDGFLKERVMNLPESAVAGTHYTQHGRHMVTHTLLVPPLSVGLMDTYTQHRSRAVCV